MEPITSRFTLIADDLIKSKEHAALALESKGPLLAWIQSHKAYVAFLAAFAFPEKFDVLGCTITRESVTGTMFVIMLVGLATTLISNFLTRRRFPKLLDANREINWTISDTEIQISSTHSQATFDWVAFQRILFTRAGFLFMANEQIFHFIPTRAFSTPADIENLKTLARQHATDFKEMTTSQSSDPKEW